MEHNQKYCKNGLSLDTVEKSIMVPYKEAIGSLIYVSNGTRPDISYAVSKLASYADCVKPSHWTGVKKIFRYLKATSDVGIHYKHDEHAHLECYSDSDFAGDIDTMKSTSGVVVMLNGAPVVWRSTKQTTTATSTTNAEFIAASLACTNIIWVRLF